MYNKIKSLLFFVFITIFFNSCAAPKEDAPEYSISTIPLYVNNQIYISDEPVLCRDEMYFIPFNIYLAHSDQAANQEAWQEDSPLNDIIIESDNVKYLPLDVLENDLGWHVYQQDSALYIDNFPFDYSWTAYTYVAHAMGGIDGYAGTNSLEAFLQNYEDGHRVFEVDLSLTADNKLVAIHDWDPTRTVDTYGFSLEESQLGVCLTQEEFKSQKILGKYTTLSFEDIADMLYSFPDVYIITDTKETEEPYVSAQFQYIVDTASQVDPSILDRIIPQVYNESMYYTIMDIYDWKSVIYTLYNQTYEEYSPREVVQFTRENGIRVVTTFSGRSDDLLLDALWNNNCLIYMHTYNDPQEVDILRSVGIHGFYTDFILP